MSSTYKILCLSHDPAIVLGWPEFQSGQGGHLTSVEAVQRGVERHPGCDLLVGRYSSPLIEVCCPSPASGPKPDGVRCCHRDPQWVDADWLRLAALAYEEPDGSEFRKAVERVAPCWTKTRLPGDHPGRRCDVPATLGRLDTTRLGRPGRHAALQGAVHVHPGAAVRQLHRGGGVNRIVCGLRGHGSLHLRSVYGQISMRCVRCDTYLPPGGGRERQIAGTLIALVVVVAGLIAVAVGAR